MIQEETIEQRPRSVRMYVSEKSIRESHTDRGVRTRRILTNVDIARFEGALLFDASNRPVITYGAIINHSLVRRARCLSEGWPTRQFETPYPSF